MATPLLCCAKTLKRRLCCSNCEPKTTLLSITRSLYSVRGLTCLTGETGAGKSILVDALALLMGSKASSDVVRHGAEKAVVSCVFESTPGAEAMLEANGIDAEGSEIILRREILENGKGRVYVNNQPATVAVLRQLAPELALWCTRRAKRLAPSIRPSSAACSIALRVSRQTQSLLPSPTGARFNRS